MNKCHSLWILIWLAYSVQIAQAAQSTFTPWVEAPGVANYGEKDIEILVGEVRIIKVAQLKRVAIGNGSLLRAQALDADELLLIGEAPGTTTLQVWHQQDDKRSRLRVNVISPDTDQDITLRKIVSTKVRMIEFRDSSLKQVGIDWAKSTEGPSFFVAKDWLASGYLDTAESFAGQPIQRVGNTQNTPPPHISRLFSFIC